MCSTSKSTACRATDAQVSAMVAAAFRETVTMETRGGMKKSNTSRYHALWPGRGVRSARKGAIL
jgi:hypothetical protein